MDKYSWYIIPHNDMPIELIISDEPVEVVEQSAKQKADQSLTYILYHLRITFDPKWDMTDQKEMVRNVLRTLRPYTDKYIASIEHFKAGMEVTKPHTHIYFFSKDKLDTIRRQLKRTHDHLQAGNKVYSLRPIIDQTVKALRYPLKQQKNDTYRFSVVSTQMKEYLMTHFNVSDISVMRDEAYAVWLTACEVYNATRQKTEEASGLQDRLFAYLDTQSLDGDKSIKIFIQRFYIEEEKKPFNKTTALGYFYAYKITKGLMTHEELADTW